MIPEYWTTFVEQNSLTGKDVSIPEDADLSGLGAELRLLDEDGIRSEMEDVYPGIVITKDGFIPVGSCMEGSGDPYFIKTSDGAGGPLYRIYHDAVGEDGYDRDSAVATVLKDYRKMLEYL